MIRRYSFAYLVPAFLALALMSGCAARVSYRTYDPYYHDYHVWTGRGTSLLQHVDRGDAQAKRGVPTLARAGPQSLLALAARPSLDSGMVRKSTRLCATELA
jgi:hypothetical protein